MSAPQNSIQLRNPGSFYIGGQWVTPSTSDHFEVVSATTEEVVARVPEAQAEDMDKAIAAARNAFDNGPWPRMTPSERGEYLSRMAIALERRASDFARVWATESGILYRVAEARIGHFLKGAFSYYADAATTFPFVERHRSLGGMEAQLVREPVGVVGAIVPWNGPAGLMAYKCSPALLAGCTLVVKSSPEAPCSAYLMAEICEEIGLPPGVFNIVTADRAVSELLVTDPRVDKITFTGSTAAGRRIASLCGERIARCTLELGGKSPAVILDDYDIDTAAQTIASGMTYVTGQVCHSLTRIIVTRHRHDHLVEALASATKGMVVGDPFEASSDIGPLATAAQRERVEHYIAVGQSEGASLVSGGQRPAHLNRGYFIEPTVFGNVTNDMTIAREEIFGPVLCVLPVDDEEQAVAVANDTIFGLNASVFTTDMDRFRAIAPKLRAGTVGHNASRTDFSIAFGGMKQSGIGREGGIEGLLPFLETKTVVFDQPWQG